jgi:Family of unknown function (DUF5384)
MMRADFWGAAPLALLLVTMSVQVRAQSGLSDQINSVYAAQTANEAAAQAQLQAQQQAAAREARRQFEADQAVRRRRDEQDAAARAEARSQRESEEKYNDQLRALDIQERELQLQQDKDRVARDNDYMDQELNRSKAATDAIEAQSNATRALSAGEKDYLDQEGEADETLSTGEKDFLDQAGEAEVKAQSPTPPRQSVTISN